MFVFTCLGDALVLFCPVAGVGYSREHPCSNNGGNEMWERCLQPEREDEPEERDHCSLWHLPSAAAISLERVCRQEREGV